jgi:hypothetical protein
MQFKQRYSRILLNWITITNIEIYMKWKLLLLTTELTSKLESFKW